MNIKVINTNLFSKVFTFPNEYRVVRLFMSKTVMSVVILAAGKGSRMFSDLPKVMHPLGGKPMVQYVIDTAMQLSAKNVYIVYGDGGNHLKSLISDSRLQWILQDKQLGTGHAIQQVAPYFSDDEDVLILYGDMPLISVESLTRLRLAKPKSGIAILAGRVSNPSGYGRVIRENDKAIRIVEHKDANEEQRKINEINTGILVVNGQDLKYWLSILKNDNVQGEYYLTDIILAAHAEGKKIEVVYPVNLIEVLGVNNCLQLSIVERAFQSKEAENLLLSGVMLLDPARFDLRGKLIYGRDITIDANVIIEGTVKLGNRVKIGIGCVLKNCEICNDCEISPYSIIEDTILADHCTVGPFARLRVGTKLSAGAHVGNFVEIKKAHLGKASKASHLSYLGDAEVGDNVNIGAGSITCNYDGANKHKTIIGDSVFIGSASQLVAPVSIGKGSTIAAGTTVTHDIAENELVLTRVKQKHIQGWIRPMKKD